MDSETKLWLPIVAEPFIMLDLESQNSLLGSCRDKKTKNKAPKIKGRIPPSLKIRPLLLGARPINYYEIS